MPEIGTSGSMSGDGKRGVAEWPKLPRPSSTLPRSVGSPRTEAGGRPSRRYGDRLFRSIAILAAAPLPVLQGRPPRVCAQALPQTGTWTMTPWNEP